MKIEFEWDSLKAELNMKKHGVAFDEAKSVFYDDYARLMPDPDHLIIESRYIIQGVSDKNKLLIVSFTERKDKIRIINASKATNKERRQYEEFI